MPPGWPAIWHEPRPDRGGGGHDGLAPHIGRQDAHDLVYAACRVAHDTGASLADALSQQPGITAHLDPAAIQRLTDPANYLGAVPAMVDRVLRFVPRAGR